MNTGIKDVGGVLAEYFDGSSNIIKTNPSHYCTQIALYASGNNGKTSSLWLTILKLAEGEPFYPEVYKLFKKSIRRKPDKTILLDVRIAFPKGDRLVYISTIGDVRSICEDNMYFFLDEKHHTRDNARNYYIIDDKLVKASELNDNVWSLGNDKKYRKFCISPCHTAGGTVDATLYCSDMLIEDENISRVIWLYKESCPKDRYKLFSAADVKVADDILALFERTAGGQHVI